MILVGNQRGSGADLARHLMKAENEQVIVHEVRGFACNDLDGAFRESHAISRATRCKQHLYSLSLNPPKEANASPELLIDAVNRAEERLGLSGQPRAIVLHEKCGVDGELRRHAHAVWCRIDTDAMKAVQMSHDHHKLNDLGRELYLEHGWKMPRGFVRKQETNPRNYSLAEWQQAKRAKKGPDKLKGMFQDCWAISDSQTSFAHALKENGYILARGDRRGVVAVDHKGEVYAVSKWVGIKAKQVRDRIQYAEKLPDVTAAHDTAKAIVTDRLAELKAQQNEKTMKALHDLKERRRRAHAAQRDYAYKTNKQQEERHKTEEQLRQSRLRTGWRGLVDRVTGKRKRILAENQIAAEKSRQRDLAERTGLDAMQRAMRKNLLGKAKSEKAKGETIIQELRTDIQRLNDIKPPVPDKPKTKTAAIKADQAPDAEREAFKAKRRRTPTSQRKKRRSNNPAINRDGPAPGR